MFSLQRGLPQCSARQSLLSALSKSSRKGALSKRFLATEAPATTGFERAVYVTGISSPAALSNILDKHPYGPIEHIQYTPDKKSAIFQFLNPINATFFKNHHSDSSFVQHSTPSADVVAAIGFRHATRCIVMNPLPDGTTEESLTAELSKFGPVEKVEIQPAAKGGDSFARVHFYSIVDAIKAVDTLETPSHFTHDRLDIRMAQPKQDAPPSDTVVKITGLEHKPTYKRVIWMVNNALVKGRDPIRQLSILDDGRVYINFYFKKHASLFVQASNSATPAPVEGGGIVAIKNQKDDPALELARRAHALGADRTLVLKLTPDADRTKLLDAFSRYGKVIDVQIPRAHKGLLGFVSYANVTDSMRALGRGLNSSRIQSLADEIGFASRYASPVKIQKPEVEVSETKEAEPSEPTSSEGKTAEL